MLVFEHETGGKFMKQMFINLFTNLLLSCKVKSLSVTSYRSMYQPNLKDLED